MSLLVVVIVALAPPSIESVGTTTVILLSDFTVSVVVNVLVNILVIGLSSSFPLKSMP